MTKRNILFTIGAILVLLGTGAFTLVPPAIVSVTPIVVTYDFVTVDSNTSGTYWAYDTFHSTVTIVNKGVNLWQLTWVDTGTFVSWDATSPNSSGTIGDGVVGNITGGQIVTVNGVLKASLPSYLGYFNFNCDHFANCPNYVSWRTMMFDSVSSYVYDQWAWTYVTCGNGTWVNADTGNIGDIVGGPSACQNPEKPWVPLSTKAYLTLTLSPGGGFIQYDGNTGSHGCFLMVNNGVPSDSAMLRFCGANPDDITQIPMLSGRVYQRFYGDTWGVWKDKLGNNLDVKLQQINQENGWMLQRMAFMVSSNPIKGGLWWIDHKMNP